MPYGNRAYTGESYAGGNPTSATGGAVIVDPSRPDLAGYRWLPQQSVGPYAGTAYGGGGLASTSALGGLTAEPDAGLGVVRLTAWWTGAPYLRITRIDAAGNRTPVRNAYPLVVQVATRRNLATNPSVEVDTAGYLAQANTTISRVVGPTLYGSAFLRAQATAAGAVNVAVPVLLPTDAPFAVSFGLRYSAAPTGALTIAVAWQDQNGASMGTTSATVTAANLATYAARWDRLPAQVITPPSPIVVPPSSPTATDGYTRVPVQGVLTVQGAGMAANATLDLDGVLVEAVVQVTGATGSTTALGATGAYFDGSTRYGQWVGTANASASALASPVTVTDGEAPLDQPVQYELAAPDQPSFIVRTEAVTLPSRGASGGPASWLSHPDGRSAFRVWVTETPELTRTAKRGLYDVLGRETPIAVATGRRTAPTGTITVHTRTAVERDRLVDMLADNQPLLLRAPAEMGYGAGWWVSIGDTVEKALTHFGGPNIAGEYIRETELPFAVCAAPASVTA